MEFQGSRTQHLRLWCAEHADCGADSAPQVQAEAAALAASLGRNLRADKFWEPNFRTQYYT